MGIPVHPRCRGRGNRPTLPPPGGNRGRPVLRKAPVGLRVVLHSAVSSGNQDAKDLLEQEGYTPVRQFWRMMIDTDESADGSFQPGKLKFDLYAEMQQLTALAQPQQRTGIYIARQYDIYEKELRAGEVVPTSIELPEHSIY